MLTALLIDHELEQQPQLADEMPKPTQHVSLLAIHEPGVPRHGLSPVMELQVVSPRPLSVAPPQTAMPPHQKAETVLGSGLGCTRPKESVRRASPFSKNEPAGSILGQLGLKSGPTVELAYAKKLLEHEQVATARALLERAVSRYPQDERLRNLYRAIAPGRVVRQDVHYRDQAIEAAWIQTHRIQYRGKWVALLGEQVLGIGDDLQTILGCIREHHLDDPPLIHHFVE